MEQHTGLEPAKAAWKAAVLPLHQCCVFRRVVRIRRAVCPSCHASLTSALPPCSPYGGAGLSLQSIMEREEIHFGSPHCHGGQSRIRTCCRLLCCSRASESTFRPCVSAVPRDTAEALFSCRESGIEPPFSWYQEPTPLLKEMIKSIQGPVGCRVSCHAAQRHYADSFGCSAFSIVRKLSALVSVQCLMICAHAASRCSGVRGWYWGFISPVLEMTIAINTPP